MRTKISITDIFPNPFRTTHLDKSRVALLVQQIDKEKGGTGFWDNLLLRPHPKKPGHYQLAYGHHRMAALRKLEYTEIESAVRDLSDAEMVKVMADENLREATDPATVLDTVRAARDYLQAALDRAKTVEEFASMVNLPHSNIQGFEKMKADGIGRGTITAFLGARWENKVRDALFLLKEPEHLQELASAVASNMFQATEVVRDAKYANLTPKEAAAVIEDVQAQAQNKPHEAITHNTLTRAVDKHSGKIKKERQNVQKSKERMKAGEQAWNDMFIEAMSQAPSIIEAWRAHKKHDIAQARDIREHIPKAPPELQQQFYDTVAEIIRDWRDFQQELMADKTEKGLSVRRLAVRKVV